MISGTNGWPLDARHCLRVGAMSDKAVIEASAPTFDVLVIQANLAVSASKGLASWEALPKPFWIDPITYAFAANPDYLKSEQKVPGSNEKRLAFKKTFLKLAEAYGEPFQRLIEEDRRLSPDDFDPAGDAALTKRIVDWQASVISVGADAKYGLEPSLEPCLLTAPFFPLQKSQGQMPWFDVNMRLAAAADSLVAPERLAIGLLIEADVFEDDEFLDRIVDRLGQINAKHVWLWLSDNEELNMSATKSLRYALFVKRLSELDKSVHVAFAGSFSALLLTRGATSIAHGVNYWERKDWEPLAGGGLPTLQYVFPPLRRRLPFLDADSVVDVNDAEEFHATICGCRICRNTLNGDITNFGEFGEVEVRTRSDRWGNVIEYDVPTPKSLRLTKGHYLHAKEIEVAEILRGRSTPSLLLDSHRRFSSQQVVPIGHLERWADALTQFDAAGEG